MFAVLVISAVITLGATCLWFIGRARGRTSEPWYLPSVFVALVGGLGSHAIRMFQYTDHALWYLPVMSTCFALGLIGSFATASPSWRGLALDDLMLSSGVALLFMTGYSFLSASPPSTFFQLDTLMFASTAWAVLIAHRIASARQPNFPGEAFYLRLFGKVLTAGFTVEFIAGRINNVPLHMVGMAVTSSSALLLARYMVLKVRSKDYAQYKIAPRPRPQFSRFIVAVTACGATVVLAKYFSYARSDAAMILGFVSVCSIIFRQMVTYAEYDKLRIHHTAQQDHFGTLVHNSTVVIMMCDVKTYETRFINEAAQDLLGVDHKAAVGTDLATLLGCPRDEIATACAHLDMGFIQSCTLESSVRGRHLESLLTLHEGQVLVTVRDATDREQLRSELTMMASIDPLTHLPNRYSITQQLEELLKQDEPGHPPCVLFLDLNRFKPVNDVAGHHIGDEVLRQVAYRLRRTAPDTCALGRLGGDEFLLFGRLRPEDAVAIAHRLVDSLHAPFTVANRRYQLGAAVGIAYAEPDSTADDLIRRADIAMYAAKEDRISAVTFHDSLEHRVMLRAGQDVVIAQALAEQRFELYLQPVVNVYDGSVHCVEALIRWREPHGTLHGPWELLDFARRTSNLHVVTSWVLREAILRLTYSPELTMSVNISPVELSQSGFSEYIVDELRKSRIDPGRLILEVSEAESHHAHGISKHALETLRANGIRVFLDDFGTRQSPLGHLVHLPIAGVKIHQQFVASLPDNLATQTLVKGLVQHAHDNGMTIIAEGVEREEEHAWLQWLNCPLAQGFLYARPQYLPPEQSMTTVSQWQHRKATDPATLWTPPSAVSA